MREKLYALKKARIRQSWNKYNLYNLMRQRPLRIEGRTYFQQKYAAKQETRRYHGEHLTKRQWQNIFRHSLHSVVPMNHRVLAGSDGSEQATGRGSGLDLIAPSRSRERGTGLQQRDQIVLRVPYMNQMWAPMERRLDIAVFRAMFASSARQARQFVVHGFVEVNGKKMIHPGYMLNPGDMFSVDPDQVLFATGKPKDYIEKQSKLKKVLAKQEGSTSEEEKVKKQESDSESDSGSESDSDSDSESETESSTAKTSTTTTTTTTTPITPATDSTGATTSTIETTATPPNNKDREKEKKEDPANPFDPSKPYLTPWEPRDYLSPFAFIPRYLEVNFNICHAVYLRHPVARPGASEVASPFGPDTQQLAFHWFLRRR